MTTETHNLRGRVALVTGASRSRGIGAAICRELAIAGADVFFSYWRPYDRTMPWGADEHAPETPWSTMPPLDPRRLPGADCRDA